MKKLIRQSKQFWKQTVLMAALAFLLSVAGAASLPIRAEAAQSGVIGTADADGNVLFWTYDEETKTLTIGGKGELGMALHGEPFQSMEIKKVQFQECKVTGSMAWAFSYQGGGKLGICEVEGIDFAGLDTSEVTDMTHMFSGCSSLTVLEFSNFDTTNVTRMSSMFDDCSSLISLELNGFNTTNVTDMGRMFEGCSSLTSLDLSGFDTTNVTNMFGMFRSCSSLTSLNLGGFNTANVTRMSAMFVDCSSLTSLDLSSFDTTNATGKDSIFFGCDSLVEIKSPHIMAEGWQTYLPEPSGIPFYGDPATFYDADLYESTGEYRTMTLMDASCAGKTLKKYSDNASGDNGDDDATAELLPDAVQYVMYEYTIPGSSPAQTMSLLEGTLPTGMELQADGKLCGIPMEAGRFVFTIGETAQTVSGGEGRASGSQKTYKLTVSDNSDANVDVTTDPGYEIIQRVPDFTWDSVSSHTLVSVGTYGEFRDVYIDGVMLEEGKDYTSEEGSTRITIRSETLERFSEPGVHTILVEFRTTESNDLRRAVQNYWVAGSSDSGQNAGSTGNGSTGDSNGDDDRDNSGNAGGSADDNGDDGAGDSGDGSAVNQNGTAANTPIKYMVVRGDVLGRIARRNGVSPNKVAVLNPELMKQKYIYPGQKVRVK